MQQMHDAEQTSLYVTADYHHLTLSSHFQPIFSISHRRPVGYEGLIRAVDTEQQPHSPLELLAIPQTGVENLSLDRLCRRLHMHNFARQPNGETWLFLNLNSQCLVSERPDAGFMNTLFESTPIGLRHGTEIIAVGIVMYLILELEKWLRRFMSNHHKVEETVS